MIEKELIDLAQSARKNAQSPYSKFTVGAAVLSADGRVSVGCNVERANYTSTSHAEQVAIDSLIAKYGPLPIIAVAVVGAHKGTVPHSPCWPCGHCRGIIWENANGNKNVRIITLDHNFRVIEKTIGQLYPDAFGPNDLEMEIF